MLPFFWIFIFCFFHSGKGQNHHTRHERTRYVSGRHQIYGSHFGDSQNYIPFVHYWERPLQILESSMNVPKKLSSRPLFSWDLPAAPIMNYTPSKKTSATEIPELSLRDAEHPTPLALTAIESKSVKKPLSDRFQRTKNSAPYTNIYDLKKKKSNTQKKSIEDTSRIIRWRQSDSRAPGKLESKKLKRKKKGKKSKKGKTGKRSKLHDLNDKANEVNPKLMAEQIKALKYEQRLGEMQKEAPEAPTPCEAMLEKCEHRCQEENGKAACTCYKGYTPMGNKCVDINECEKKNGGCNGKCINTIGSWKCICSPGFRLIEGVCVDINECLLRNGHGPCQDRCTNTMGSYTCSCEGLPGTSLSSDKHTCEASNECSISSVGCSHSCISISGTTFCTCPDGLELGEDWKTCHDIDECSSPEDYNVDCPKSCINTVGSYTCIKNHSTTKENST